MVPVNFSVSSQGNVTWVILATTNTRRRSRKILFDARGGVDLSKIYFRAGICHHSDFFNYILNSKVIQQYQIELFGTQVDLPDINQRRDRQTRPKHHTYKDHVSLDRLFLLSNLTWRRAHVTVMVNVLRRFH